MAEQGKRFSLRLKNRPSTESPAKKQRTKLNVRSGSVSPEKNDSPPNEIVLPQLNDACLLKVFEHLNLQSLCSTADVSKRFRELSMQVFAKNFDELQFFTLNRQLFRCVMRKFGQHITSIEFNQSTLASDDVRIMNKYCSNLEKLSLTTMQVRCNDFVELLARLKFLCLSKCDFTGDPHQLFAACTEIEYLTIDAKKYSDYPKCCFPKLKTLRFECGDEWKWNYLWQVLQPNPQIKRLYIVALPDDEVIMNVVRFAPQLEALCFESSLLPKSSNVQTVDGLLKLAELKSLKVLSLHTGAGDYSVYASELANILSNTKEIKLEFLCFESFAIDRQDLHNILTLKTLEKLVLVSMDELNNSDLVMIAQHLPSLQQLRIDTEYSDRTVFNIIGLMTMIECAKNLTFLGVNGIRDIKIDENTFMELVAVAKKSLPLKLAFIGCKTTTEFNVPHEIQSKHRSELRIDYRTDDNDECSCPDCSELKIF